MKSLATLAAVLAAPFLVGAAPAAKPSTAACALAREVVAKILDGYQGKPVVFSADPRQHFDAQSLRVAADAPHGALVRAFQARPPPSAVTACPEVRMLLDARQTPYGAEAEAEAMTRRQPRSLRMEATLFWILRPVVSRDGREALVETGSVCGGLCGYGELRPYTREPDGTWRPGKPLGMWFS